MSFVSYCCGGSEEERAGDHGGNEGEAEEGERVVGERAPVPCADGTLIGAGFEFLGLERWHRSSDRVVGE